MTANRIGKESPPRSPLTSATDQRENDAHAGAALAGQAPVAALAQTAIQADDPSLRTLADDLPDITALERAKVERVNHRRVLAGINRIFETLLSGDDAAFPAACRAEAEALTGSPWSCLHEQGPDGALHRVASTEPASGAVSASVIPGRARRYPEGVMAGIYARVVGRDETLMIDGVSLPGGDGDAAAAAAAEPVPMAFLGVPLKHRDRVIGIIAVADRAGGYGPTERDTLEALAPAIAQALALRNAEAALAAAREETELEHKRFGALLEASPAAVVLIDAATRRFVYLNRRALELYGADYGGVELAAHAAQVQVLRADGTPYPMEEWPVNRCLASGEVVHQEEMIFRRADGTPFPVAVGAAPVMDALGQMTSAVVLFDDISELKRTETALHETGERLRIALAAARLGTFDYYPQSDRLEWDDQLLRMWGLRRGDSLTYAQVFEHLHADDRARVEALAAQALAPQGGGDYQAEYRIVRPDGSVRWHETRGGVRFELGADGSRLPARVSGVVRDVTDRKAAEAALVELNRALEARVAEVSRQADQLRGLASQLSRAEQRERQRLARILHDNIQQLIVAAQMQASTLLRESTTERQRAAATTVQDVLKEALVVSRSLTVDLVPPVLFETGLIGGLDWLAERMQEQQGFTVRLHADTRAEPAAEELRFLLFECARELLLNVAKHAGVRAADLMLVRPRGGELELSVSDEGAGFDADVVTRRRADETSFGLFSIKERLAHLGGHMTILSAPERGTQVTLNVPMPDRQRHANGSVAAEQAARAGAMMLSRMPDSLRVLIVDDHQIMRQGLAGLFQCEADIEVVGEAAAGDEALAMAAELRPDVVVMDVNLGGGIDGIEATRRLLADDPEMRVIGLSMHEDSAVVAAMRDAGAIAYLTKGGPCEELLAAIRDCDGD